MFNLKKSIFWKFFLKIIAHFHRPPGAIFERFGNFPHTLDIPRVCGKLPKAIILQQNFAVEMCRRSHIFFKNYENSHGHRENFLMGIFSENKMGYSPKKFWEKFLISNFSRWTPTLGILSKWDSQKMAKNGTFGHF